MVIIQLQKLFLFLRYLNFCPEFFGHVGKQLGKKAKLKFMTLKPGNKWLQHTYWLISQEVKAVG